MKGKLIAAISIFLLFIPTYIAVAFYITAQNSPVSDSVVYKMIMRDVDGETFEFTRGSGEAETMQPDGGTSSETDIISFFINMNKNAVAVAALPEPLLGADCYTVTYYSYNLETTYKYYFTTDKGNSFLVNNNGEAFRISESDARTFVTSKYAVSLYKEAAAPEMTLSGTNIIKPYEMTWKYRLSDGVYSDAVVPKTDKRETFRISGALNLSFDIEPDNLWVRIANGEEVIFNDLYSNLTPAPFSESGTLTIGITAKWNENEERGSFGEAKYTFVADVHAPAEFYLGVQRLEPGEFVAITGKNVEDPAAITFVSEPDIGFTPVFFRDGDYVTALVPISYDLEYSPSYKFTITSGDSVSELTLGVDNKKFRSSNYDVSAEIIASTRTQSSITAFNEAMEPYFANREPIRFWTPGTLFGMPSSDPTDLVQTGIGIYRTLTATGTTYRHPGVDFMVSEGTNVLAVCDGKVIYAGTQTMSGRIVVIEHGFGLKSIYAHMSSISVAEGDLVKKGDVIGVVGSTGFTKGINLHFGLYVFSTPVSPYDIWGWETVNGIAVTEP